MYCTSFWLLLLFAGEDAVWGALSFPGGVAAADFCLDRQICSRLVQLLSLGGKRCSDANCFSIKLGCVISVIAAMSSWAVCKQMIRIICFSLLSSDKRQDLLYEMK